MPQSDVSELIRPLQTTWGRCTLRCSVTTISIFLFRVETPRILSDLLSVLRVFVHLFLNLSPFTGLSPCPLYSVYSYTFPVSNESLVPFQWISVDSEDPEGPLGIEGSRRETEGFVDKFGKDERTLDPTMETGQLE